MLNEELLKKLIVNLYEYMLNILNCKEVKEIVLTKKIENINNPFSKTAYYDIQNNIIYLYISGRHIKDILRSLAHEIVHHNQFCNNQIELNDLQNDNCIKNNKKLRELEREAYEKGNLIFRDWEEKQKDLLKENKTFLLESGAAGHIKHLYDNLNLTFSEIKDVLKKAASGQLKGTEKIDGQNIYLSYSVKEKKVKAARNKNNIKLGGLTIEDLLEKTKEKVRIVFNEAINAWNEMVKTLPVSIQVKLFGLDGNIFYNVEIQDPRLPNVINYNTKNLVIHQKGHVEVNKETGELFSKNIKNSWEILNAILEKNKIKKYNYDIINNAVITLQALSDKKPLLRAIKSLEKELEKTGITDKQTIEDFLTFKLREKIKESSIKLPETTYEEIIKRIIGYKGITINSIFKTLSNTKDKKIQKEKVREILRDSKKLLKEAILPIELIIHDFSVEMLKGLHSAFVLDQNEEVQRIKKELLKAIKIIEKTKNSDMIEFLRKQMNKIKSMDNILTAAEGFVFTYNGKIYKFTGNFAPINQILGMLKYNKREKLLEDRSPKKIAIFPGAFKPPHVGHYLAVKYLEENTDAEEIVVLISSKPRSVENKEFKIEVTSEKALEIWYMFIKNEHKIWADIAKSDTPINDTFEIIKKLSPGSCAYVGVSEKDLDDKRFDDWQKWSEENNAGVKIKKVIIPVESFISGTEMRHVLLSNKKSIFFKYLPKHLSKLEKNSVWKILKFEQAKIDRIEEESSMGAGSIAGAVMTNKKENNLSKREDLYMKIKEEKEFRNVVKKLVEQKINTIRNQKESLLMVEEKFRRIIKKMVLNEAIKTTPHFSTGINVLKELLKKIIPIVEIDYKQLTTNKFQRDSFRSHIVNGVKKTIEKERVPAEEDVFSNKKTDLEIDDDFNQSEQESSIKNLDEQEDFSETNFDIGESGDEVEKKEDLEKEKFIDIRDEDEKEKEKEKEKVNTMSEEDFSLSGHDETGRNLAYQTYQKIERDIIRSFSVLSFEKDKDIFEEYFITNIKMYFDKFEEELSVAVKEPTTKQYIQSQKV